jgi:hypothetical protein
LAARSWGIQITNHGGPSSDVKWTGVSLVQSGGPACTTAPVVGGSFPSAAAGNPTLTAFTINFGACAATSRFTVTIGMTAGGMPFTTTLGNQFP